MSSTADPRNGALNSTRSIRRVTKYVAYAFALVVALVAYCELCALATNHPPRELAASVAWALQAAAGWIFIGAALGLFGERLLEHPSVQRYPRTVLACAIVATGTFVLMCEALLALTTGSEQDLSAFLYQRAPVIFAASGLLIVVFAGRRFILHPLGRRDRPHSADHGDARPGRTAPSDASQASEHTIEVLTGTGYTNIRVGDIESLEADRNYINVVHVSGRTYLLRQTMAVVERTLDAREFVRIHRSTIVNTRRIKERRRGNVLLLHSGRTVSISRAFRERALAQLKSQL